MCSKETLYETNTFSNVGTETLQALLIVIGLLNYLLEELNSEQ